MGLPFVAGIDEAGFGPLLGPLVISGTVFERSMVAPAGFFATLTGAPESDDLPPVPPIPGIADSKQLYTSGGLRRLEEGVLGVASLLQVPGSGLRELLTSLRQPFLDDWNEYPWYRQQDLPLPAAAGAEAIAKRAAGLKPAFAAAGITPRALRSIVIDVDRYNRMIARTDNKSTAEFEIVAHLLRDYWRDYGERGIDVACDRLGGRKRYGDLLTETIPGATLRVLREEETISAYQLQGGGRILRVQFEVGGDARWLPVALSSMLCKYLRELHMNLFNAWWQAALPGLSPTAGYYEDGLRFLGEIDAARRERGIPETLLRRAR